MRILSLGVLVLLVAAGAQAGRYAEPYTEPLLGSEDDGYEFEVAYDDGGFEFWGTNPSWASEMQVGFAMPNGDPWLLYAVRLWVSGSFDHQLVIRGAQNGIESAPGDIIDESIVFNPGYSSPPLCWIWVDISCLGIVLSGGEEIFIGIRFDGIDDGIGLDEDSGTGGHTWGSYRGVWYHDSAERGVSAGIRIRVVESAFSPIETTWGKIKAHYGAPAK